MPVFTGKTLHCTGRDKKCRYHVLVNIDSVLLDFSNWPLLCIVFLGKTPPQNMELIHPRMTPLSPDCQHPPTDLSIPLWSGPHRMGPWVIESCWQADLHPLPTDGSKGPPECHRACPSVLTCSWWRYRLDGASYWGKKMYRYFLKSSGTSVWQLLWELTNEITYRIWHPA